MLVVARRPGESLLIGSNLELTVKEINSSHIKYRRKENEGNQ